MKENKHIDRLFQERFKDFEAQPDPNVWKNIEKDLMKKKNKKRILPLWFRIAGAAVVLFGLISIGYFLINNDINSNNPQEGTPENNTIITNTDNKTLEKSSTEKEDAIPKKIETDTPANQKIKSNTNGTSIAQKATVRKRENSENDLVEVKTLTNENQNRALADTRPAQNTEINTTEQEKDAGKTQGLEPKEKEKPNSANDIFVTKNMDKKDVQEEVNKLEKQELDISGSKWTIGSVIAPVYFNSLSDGSPVSPALNNNAKSGNNTLAYGVKINYKLNDKLSIQSGINSVDLSYTTNNVAPRVSAFGGSSENVNIQTNGNKVGIEFVSTLQTVSDASGYRTSYDINGSLEQNYGYIEVPVEAKYNLLEKKVGINVVGGFSTYFLKDNELVVTSFGQRSALGKASNLNNVNFSGNMGVDIDYKLSKKLFINITPMVKYQFNTFSENSGGFQPYYFGIYSGLNFRF